MRQLGVLLLRKVVSGSMERAYLVILKDDEEERLAEDGRCSKHAG